MQSFKLEPINGRKSFHGKATVIVENNVSKLKSYETMARHINAFLNYYGFDTCSKKELENYNQ